MKKAINRVVSGFHYLTGGLQRVVEWVMVAMVLTIVYDVSMRYVFSAPTYWSVEMNEYAMVFITFIPLAEMLRIKRHIKMTLLFDKWPLNAQLGVESFYLILGLIFCGVTAYTGAGMVSTAYKYHFASSSLVGAPLWIPYAFVPVGMGLFGLAILGNIVGNIQKLTAGKQATGKLATEGEVGQ